MTTTTTTTHAGIDAATLRACVAEATLATLERAKADAEKARRDAERAEAWLAHVTREAEAGTLDDINVPMSGDSTRWLCFLDALNATGDDALKARIMYDQPGINIDRFALERVFPDFNPKPGMLEALARFRS